MIKDIMKNCRLEDIEKAAPISNAKMREHLLKSISDCGCECHDPSIRVRHMFPCCDACYKSVEDVHKKFPSKSE